MIFLSKVFISFSQYPSIVVLLTVVRETWRLKEM